MSHNARPVKNTITGKTYPSILKASQEVGIAVNTIKYWLNKSKSGKTADWEYLEK